MEQPQHGVHDLLLFRHLDFHCNAIHVLLSDPGPERIKRLLARGWAWPLGIWEDGGCDEKYDGWDGCGSLD